jgi:hypothetical protein
MDRGRVPGEADVELLWAAASPAPDVERVRELAERADVAYVIETATEHRVGPLVVRALREAGVGVDPADVPPLAAAWQARSLLSVPVAARAALGPLVEAGLAPLVFKGIALVDRYPSPGLRPMDDIDILVPADRFDDAVVELERSGWTRAQHATGTYDIPFRHRDAPDVFLELHHEISDPRELPSALSATALWQARRPMSVYGYDVWTLPPELEIVVLATHAAKIFHRFDRLLWTVDLAVVIRSAEIDWGIVAALSARAQRRVATAIALRLASRLGAEVPQAMTLTPGTLGRSGAVAFMTDPARPFRREPKARTPWLAFALIDDFRGMARMAIGDLREPPWSKSRLRVVRDIAEVVARGAGGFIRAKTSSSSRGSG